MHHLWKQTCAFFCAARNTVRTEKGNQLGRSLGKIPREYCCLSHGYFISFASKAGTEGSLNHNLRYGFLYLQFVSSFLAHPHPSPTSHIFQTPETLDIPASATNLLLVLLSPAQSIFGGVRQPQRHPSRSWAVAELLFHSG